MADPAEQVTHSLQAAAQLYHRLVLIVGESGTGKTALIQKLAEQRGVQPININLHLSQALLELTQAQRKLKLREKLEQAVSDSGDTVFFDNIEILFDVALEQDPLRLLQELSRNLTVVAAWNGTHENGKLTYAQSGHREYKRYDSQDSQGILIVGMSGEATVDLANQAAAN